MERAQAKGEVAEAELRALEMDVTGKVSILVYPLFFFFHDTFPGCLDHARFLARCTSRSYSSPPRGTSIDFVIFTIS